MTPLEVEHDPVATALATVRRRLLECRVAAGHWEGELSSSALSTATASFALWLHGRDAAAAPGEARDLAAAGARWLTANQNTDGGWGDTTRSRSNISTTALCWAALGAIGGDADTQRADSKATAWLEKAAGAAGPGALGEAIARRYGEDRTFSVPILTMCALAGRFGPATDAWRNVPQLPFELAALPQGFFRFLRLPVVSYALPALIAIGLVRHRGAGSWNLPARLLRAWVTPRTLRVLRQIQPDGGGFLEATPLTSFVAMSLIAAGEGDHPVVKHAVGFLVRSVRPDGSWPIDTNLATWVTTLSVSALSADRSLHEHLAPNERLALRRWLLEQQYREPHPYTGAAPGGWAWTDLPGGVPDADDTAGALIALHHLGDIDARCLEAASMAIIWLLGLQNRDGGIPTFCRGWGALPFDRSAPELTAHALHAWSLWRQHVAAPLADRMDGATERAMTYLRAEQRADGSWAPLWFGNEAAPAEENPTYGTSRVLWSSLASCGRMAQRDDPGMISRAVDWLLRAQNADGGWGGAQGVASSIEETGHALAALSSVAPGTNSRLDRSISSAVMWMAEAVNDPRGITPSPLGLYFARLWYSERLYPLIGATTGLGAAIARSRRIARGGQ